MADDLEQGVSGVAQACFTFLDGMLLRTKNALSRRRSLPMIMIYIVLFALFGWWVGIQIHAYYIFKTYGLTWFENQLPSVSEVAGEEPLKNKPTFSSSVVACGLTEPLSPCIAPSFCLVSSAPCNSHFSYLTHRLLLQP
jgi:hypothetical protein